MAKEQVSHLPNANPLFKRNSSRRRLSKWFVTNQKNTGWDKGKLNLLHIGIILLMTLVYTCHVVGSPFLRFVQHENTLISIYVLETVFLIFCIICFVKMCYVNGSWTAGQLIFKDGSIRVAIFSFWMLRCLITEILKGQVIYSFAVSFHGIMIFGTDTWYICDRKILFVSIIMYLSMVVYEFLVSISPAGPKEPSWTFMNVEVTANDLSRSNFFNLFVIFFDGLIMLIHDVNRSKYMMLTKKRKRQRLQALPEKVQKLERLWLLYIPLGLITLLCYLVDSATRILSADLGNILFGIFGGCCILLHSYILYSSSSSESRKIFYSLMRERRVILILVLLGILFYVDTFVKTNFDMSGWLFPLIIMEYISLDMVTMYFPRRPTMAMLAIIFVALLYNIFNNTFLRKDCKQYMLQWGIFGESISYCTVKRLVHQTITSLLASAAVATFRGRMDNLFFCNSNIYRSTGTIDRISKNENYVKAMGIEKSNAFEQRHRLPNELGRERDLKEAVV